MADDQYNPGGEKAKYGAPAAAALGWHGLCAETFAAVNSQMVQWGREVTVAFLLSGDQLQTLKPVAPNAPDTSAPSPQKPPREQAKYQPGVW